MPTATIRRLGSGVWGKVEPAKLKPSGYGVRLRFLVAYWRVSGIGKVRKELGANVRSFPKKADLSQERLAGPVSVLTFDIFQQRPKGEPEWLKPCGACREAEMGQ